MTKSKWQYSGDVNILDYGGKFIRQVAHNRYHVIEFTNMDDVCGDDNKGQPKYAVDLSEVDLSVATLAEAAAFCGLPDDIYNSCTHVYSTEPDKLLWLAEAVHSYGQKAPLDSWSGNNGHAMLRLAKRASNDLLSDMEAYEQAMERPVNKLGSTAREFQRGDIVSALERGLQENNPAAKIVARMYGHPHK